MKFREWEFGERLKDQMVLQGLQRVQIAIFTCHVGRGFTAWVSLSLLFVSTWCTLKRSAGRHPHFPLFNRLDGDRWVLFPRPQGFQEREKTDRVRQEGLAVDGAISKRGRHPSPLVVRNRSCEPLLQNPWRSARGGGAGNLRVGVATGCRDLAVMCAP